MVKVKTTFVSFSTGNMRWFENCWYHYRKIFVCLCALNIIVMNKLMGGHPSMYAKRPPF
ncbi:hypothetical protein HanIR_Chr17g0848451 [Helianthus annuus]|nr:hypothetical protein HanIR_Chr17g0848451 [Helianthus annuus]